MAGNESDAEKAAGSRLDYDLMMAEEYILSDVEKNFILSCERGDLPGVKKILEEFEGTDKFNINCTDPMNRSALISAIENENFDLMVILLEHNIEVGDALLHAISEEYVEAVEELLQWEETNHKEGQPYSWEAVDRSKSTFTVDITPLILAAHRNNYEILKILLDRGATLPMPHDVKCGCDECVTSQTSDSLRHSQSRINAYRALSASSLIALSSRDPVLTAFQLSWELKRLQAMESEFRAEYTEMRQAVQNFVTSLLDHARTSMELEVMLNFNHEPSHDIWCIGQRQTLDRLKLAIRYKQKTFVAHPNVQQLLAAIWYDGLPGFRRKQASQQLMDVIKLGCSFPIYSMKYILAPDSEGAKFMRKPFVKFITHSCSYMFFLMLLGAASLRVVQITFELLAFPWMITMLDDWRKHERGSLPGPIELAIITYIMALVFEELKSLYSDGLFEYIMDLWNIVDFISNMFYVTWILCRATAWIIVHRDLWFRGIDPYFPREHWHPFDPMLLSEGAFAAGMVFSYLKLVHIFSINPHLGPLQVSLGRMIIDIIKFFFIYTLVLFAFGCGLNQLLWYYAEMEKNKCYHLHPDVADFDDQEKACTIWRRFSNLFETSQSLFWASFGLVDLVSFDLAGIKSFTRFWALLMFGSYSVINIIVLLNMLIAMMSNSYQIISERADTEWKFARSQLWMSYFEDGGTIPPPFNLCPNMKMLRKTLGRKRPSRTKSFMRKSMERAQVLHDKVMKLLVRRFVTAEQRKRDDYGITEDDIIEVRQDISSLRFELLEIFTNNSWDVPDIEKKTAGVARTTKGKVMERRILKDFQIGFVENLKQEMNESEGGLDIFASLAKVIGKKKTQKGEKDWNAIARKNTFTADPIGSKRSSMQRHSQRSLRRKIIEQANEGLAMDQHQLIEFNPNLGEVTRATRVAYVKFMRKKMAADEVSLADDEETPKTDEQRKLEGTMSKKAGAGGLASVALARASVKNVDEKSADGTDSKSAMKKPADDKKSATGDDKDKKSESKPAAAGAKASADQKPVPAAGAPKPQGSVKPGDQQKPNAPAPPSKPADTKPAAPKPGEPAKPEAAVKKEEAAKTEAAKPAAAGGAAKSAAPAAPADAKPDPNAKTPAADAPGATKAANETPSAPTQAGAGQEPKAASDGKTPAPTKTDEAKPGDGKSEAKPGDDKHDKKPSDDKDKKPADDKDKKAAAAAAAPPLKPAIKVGQSSAAAGGERGKSTVTGRMISGWL
ncbi:transient receptor potential protein [Drosophila guanche]|uniref:Blast:Transient receptor potential protein n=2 Tax=Drosophila guanche TaxID=7266 RepID=A0A3B0JEU9_DROGU|nr:transient receptor potential protein [Drosophila guanche]SPP80904.1 blast:Transient receptor potential protein [Drosophila guanche]